VLAHLLLPKNAVPPYQTVLWFPGSYALMVGETLPLPALEQRLKALILVSGGLLPVSFPFEVDPINFAPRIKVPVLLLGGRYDYQSPVEDSQVALFNLFGTPAADKSHVIVNSGHVPERAVLIREILEWLDRYLGPVKVKAG
jgi:pimeloyl-ACP methyl ester carboxylesterase